MNTQMTEVNNVDEAIDKMAEVYGGKIKWGQNVNLWHKYKGAHDVIEKPGLFAQYEKIGQLTLERGGDDIAYTDYLIHDVVLRIYAIKQDMTYEEWDEDPCTSRGHKYGSHAYNVFRLKEAPEFNSKNILDFDANNYPSDDVLGDWTAMWGWECGFANAVDDIVELLMDTFTPTKLPEAHRGYRQWIHGDLFDNFKIKANYDIHLLCNDATERGHFMRMVEELIEDVMRMLVHNSLIVEEVA
jgi:hypothetical protein